MNLDEIIENGISLAKQGRYKAALDVFDEDICFTQNAAAMAYYALCLAEEEKNIERVLSLCFMAVEKEFYNPDVYLNLGRILVLNRQKSTALKSFKKGLGYDSGNNEIIAEIKRLGLRKKPAFPFLPRGNPLNKYFGMLSAGMLKKSVIAFFNYDLTEVNSAKYRKLRSFLSLAIW